MKSSALVRKVAAVASTAVLAGLVAGLAASPAQAAAKPRVKPKVSVSTPKASDRDYQGSCPANITFSATVKVKLKGKTTVAYRWLHGDGSKSKVKTVKVSAKGTKSIKLSEKATFKGDVKGWQRLEVLSPRKVVSKKGYFSVDCVQAKDVTRTHLDKRVSAKAWASPSTYVGYCNPGSKIDFVGRISVERPSWVRYRWVVNGKTVDYGKVKVRDSRKVGVGFSPRHSHKGSAVLEVLSPDRAVSNRAYYKVHCKDYTPAPAPRVKVDASNLVTATNHDGCKVSAHARVSASGSDRVRWVWSVNGSTVDSGSTTFHRGGAKTVTLSDTALSGAAKNGGTVRLSVFGSNDRDSIAQSYAACQAPKPSVSVSSVSVAGQRNEMCADNRGPGVDFKATLTSTGPATVQYYWVVDGKRDHNTLERQVNGSLDVTWGVGGTRGASVTAGSVELVVVSPNATSSGTSQFSATCPPKEAPQTEKPA
ncbi:hypothetical protein [Nonomuraea harbinensis]|uniref:Ig-like domain-containing protein n=1 Tax=Nonomuraea harbinensis TaxID=1286938 RepID=A0ABW1BUU1_9ACTN|nr:hypothetical protein [Nonomuraea harbinensis]